MAMSGQFVLKSKVMSEDVLSLCHADLEAIRQLRQAVADGKHWYTALLEAIGLWSSGEEVHRGQHYRYLIGNEAFDWLLLAERLCLEIDGAFSEDEKADLLFFGVPPIDLPQKEFKRLIGEAKYRAYLNYLYGVTVEEALVAVVEEEIYRERKCFVNCQDGVVQQEAYHRVYGADLATLLGWFRQEKGNPVGNSMTLCEQKEFVYWLFKYRLDHCDKARVASDTKKALQWLQRQWSLRSRRKKAGAIRVQEPSVVL